MAADRRKVTFKLYPSPTQAERLDAWLGLHCGHRAPRDQNSAQVCLIDALAHEHDTDGIAVAARHGQVPRGTSPRSKTRETPATTLGV